MSKVVFAVRAHMVTPGAQIVDVIVDNRLLCTIAGAEDTGIRIMTKHQLNVEHAPGEGYRLAPDLVTVKPKVWPPMECRECGYAAQDRGNGATADYWKHMGEIHKVGPGVLPEQN